MVVTSGSTRPGSSRTARPIFARSPSRKPVWRTNDRICIAAASSPSLMPTESLEPAHGAHLHRVDHRDRVAPGDEEGAGRHPAVPRGLHAHGHARRGLGHPLEPGPAPLEPGGAVLEGHPLALLLAAVVHGTYRAVRLGDVHTGVDHLPAPLSAAGRWAACRVTRDRNLLEGIRGGPEPLIQPIRGRARVGQDAILPYGVASRPRPHVGVPARQNLHCTKASGDRPSDATT